MMSKHLVSGNTLLALTAQSLAQTSVMKGGAVNQAQANELLVLHLEGVLKALENSPDLTVFGKILEADRIALAARVAVRDWQITQPEVESAEVVS